MSKNIKSGLYAITDRDLSLGRSHLDVMRAAIEGGATTVQYRAKEESGLRMYMECTEIKRLCADNNVIFIVNDRVDLAIAVDADGVHLGQDDLPYSVGRELVGPEKIVGISTLSVEQALEAEKAGADYIGVGPVFHTDTKKYIEGVVGLELLAEVVKQVNIPIVAIGGIKAANVAQVAETGAECAAVISGIVSAEDVRAAAAEIAEIMRVTGGK